MTAFSYYHIRAPFPIIKSSKTLTICSIWCCCYCAKHTAAASLSNCPAAAQNTCRDLIKIADGFKQQDAQDPHTGAFDHGGLRRKEAGEKISEQNNHKNRDCAAHSRQSQTQPQNFPASSVLTSRVVLACERGRRLTKSRNDVIGEVFKIHGDGAARDRSFAEAVDRRLHENICKAEYRPCTADGIPVFRTFHAVCREKAGLRSVSRNRSSRLSRRSTSSAVCTAAGSSCVSFRPI